MSKKDELRKEQEEYWREEVEQLKADFTHSSSELGTEVLNIIERFVQKQLYRNRTELFQSYSKLMNAIVRAKPLMALFYTYSHRIFDFIEALPKDDRDILKMKKSLLEEIQNIRTESATRQKLISKYSVRLIMDQYLLLTHSSSKAVEAMFLEGRKRKKHFRVVCTESRPQLEGTQLAIRLAKAGIKTVLISDAEMCTAVQKSNFIITGADRITETTFINKIGTYTAALLAREFHIPFYLLADTAKILPKRKYPAKFFSSQEHLIYDKKVNYLSVENFYFEEIPLSLVHKIICENGIFETEEFTERYLNF